MAILMSTLNISLLYRKLKNFHTFASWPSIMTDLHWLELPMFQTSAHGPKDGWAIEVWLYVENERHNLCLQMCTLS